MRFRFGVGWVSGTSYGTSFHYHDQAANTNTLVSARERKTLEAGRTYTFSVERAHQTGTGGSCSHGLFSVLFTPFSLGGIPY